MEQDKRAALDLVSALPMATLLAVVLSIATGVVTIVDTDKLSFQQYMTQIVVVWGGISVGRGLAAKKQVDTNSLIAKLNAFPWATVVAIIAGTVGFISVVINTDGSLDWDAYSKQMAVLVGALGVGRGIGVFKKDAVGAPIMEPEDDHIDLVEDDAGIEEDPAVQPE